MVAALFDEVCQFDNVDDGTLPAAIGGAAAVVGRISGAGASVAPETSARSKVSLSEAPGCKMTLACSEELMEQADGLAHRGGF